MSVQTWKDDYYPLAADELPDDATLQELLAHAILKWEGLRQENLDRHELRLSPGMRYLHTRKGDKTGFIVNGTTCSLCVHCTCRSLAEGRKPVPHRPRYLCPLEVIREDGPDRTCPCDVPTRQEYKSPYHRFASDAQVEPMRQLLQQAYAWLEANPDADELLSLEVPGE